MIEKCAVWIEDTVKMYKVHVRRAAFSVNSLRVRRNRGINVIVEKKAE